jgi:thiol:disulfide interchange protein DsbA
MRSLRFVFAAAAMIASTAFAAPNAPVQGVDYVPLATPQPAQTVGKKVEVVEFFAYHCPHCYSLEPTLHAWVQKNADNVNFKRIPYPFLGPTDPEARLYLTLEAMGKVDEVGPKVFRAFHVERQRLMKDDVIIDWIAKNGVDKAKFMQAWNSFGVLTKLKRLPTIVGNYKIDSVPALVVDGRYMTSPSVVSTGNRGMNEGQANQAVTQVLDHLVARVQKEKGVAAQAKPAK